VEWLSLVILSLLSPPTASWWFYVLAVFTLFALLQNFAWMTFGTISNKSFQHFGLADDGITLIAGK
jgi:hypothetical protein